MTLNSLITQESLTALSPFLERHPLNEGFRWIDHVGPRRLLTDRQIDSYDRDGYVVLENVFSDQIIESVVDTLASLAGKAEQFHDATFTIRPAVEAKVLRAFCAMEVFRDLCHDLLGNNVRLYWDQAVYKRPGRTSFPWHQDNGYQYVEPQQYLTCWVALSDASEASGCPWVFPGIHRSGTLQHRPSEYGMTCVAPTHSSTDLLAGARVVPVGAGGIVVFSSLTPHATGPNRTLDERRAYILQFAPDGAETVSEEGRRPCTSAAQFPILIDGVAAPELA
jgi:phytanoyl-CoA hydroxylase